LCNGGELKDMARWEIIVIPITDTPGEVTDVFQL
jgi:hypothetical protein